MGTADPIINNNGSSNGDFYSAETSAPTWAGFNNCLTTPIVENLPDVVPTDNSSVTKISYPKPGNAVSPVQFYKVVGGGHSLPGPQMFYNGPVNRDINGPELIWRFFKDVSGITDVTQPSFVVPEKASLSQNFPNPFNPSTTITFTLPGTRTVALDVFDVTGRHIRSIVNGTMGAGVHTARWDGRDDRGSAAASGAYFITMKAGSDFAATRKMILAK